MTKIYNCIRCKQEIELAHSSVEESENDEWYSFNSDGRFDVLDISDDIVCNDCALEEFSELF